MLQVEECILEMAISNGLDNLSVSIKDDEVVVKMESCDFTWDYKVSEQRAEDQKTKP